MKLKVVLEMKKNAVGIYSARKREIMEKKQAA